ncbi:MDR family MFS transporter [Streptomyces sp. NPDC088354]|uniref:MDR family MFS transporter n=1 Tax=unclassified Streptomyces TaxID=2593676 RepID=UPI0029B6B6DA|nr:MFS transporter [Streptomyces sp. MI02-7b]MDX3075449.1 MFS transporter [Streptomyces sp. MI02-7b]
MRWTGGAVFGGLPRGFWWLWSSTLVNRLGTFVYPFLTLYLTLDRGFSATAAGLVVSCFGLGSVAGSLVGGELSDRLGRRATMAGSYVVTAAVTAALAVTPQVAAMAVLTFLFGAGSSAPRPALSAMIADLVGPEDRQRAFSLNYWAVNIGFGLSSVMAGFLVRADFVWIFVGDAATTLVCGLMAWLLLPETRPAANDAVPAPTAGPAAARGLTVALRDGRLLALTAVSFALWLLFHQGVTTLPVAMEAQGLSTRTYGLVIGLNGLVVVLLQIPLSRGLRGRRPGPLLAGAAVLFGAGFGVTALAGSAATVYGLGVVIWTVGEMVFAPTSAAAVADLSPSHLRGRYQGVFGFGTAAASCVAPIAGGIVLDRAGGSVLWAGCAAVGLLAACAFLVLRLGSGPGTPGNGQARPEADAERPRAAGRRGTART